AVHLRVAIADLPRQRRADVLDQHHGILLAWSPFHDGLEDRAQISNWYILLDEAAQNVGDALDRCDFHGLLHELAVLAFHSSEQLARLLNAEKMRRVAAERL